jgi:hypothetical protein
VSYYYLNYKHQESQKPESILLSLLSQLLTDMPELWPSLEELYSKPESSRLRPGVQETLDLFRKIEEPRRVILVIDALDEAASSTRTKLLSCMSELSNTGLRFFLTSRLDVDLKILRSQTIVMDITARTQDLMTYVTKHLEDSQNVQDVLDTCHGSIVEPISELIVANSGGMYARLFS